MMAVISLDIVCPTALSEKQRRTIAETIAGRIDIGIDIFTG
jgi:hypothetical protein